MRDFAKVFNSEKYGQIIVMVYQTEDLLPSIRFMIAIDPEVADRHVGIGEASLTFEATEKGEIARDWTFEVMSLASAENAASKIDTTIDESTDGSPH